MPTLFFSYSHADESLRDQFENIFPAFTGRASFRPGTIAALRLGQSSCSACRRWHRQKRRQENDSALRLLFHLALWQDARPGGPNDVQLGTLTLEAYVRKAMIGIALLLPTA